MISAIPLIQRPIQDKKSRKLARLRDFLIHTVCDQLFKEAQCTAIGELVNHEVFAIHEVNRGVL